jgi:hypothetical protein
MRCDSGRLATALAMSAFCEPNVGEAGGMLPMKALEK